MNSINANIPVVNMPQVSHLHSEVQRAPAVHQVQNAQIAGDRLELKVRTAQEAEQTEGKIVDPDDHKEESHQSKKRERNGDESDEKNEDGSEKHGTAVTMSDSGRLIDLEA